MAKINVMVTFEVKLDHYFEGWEDEDVGLVKVAYQLRPDAIEALNLALDRFKVPEPLRAVRSVDLGGGIGFKGMSGITGNLDEALDLARDEEHGFIPSDGLEAGIMKVARRHFERMAKQRKIR